MWAEGGLASLPGGPATLTPTVLAEATIIPRAVLDLGLGVDVQEGALLVAALPCGETHTCIQPRIALGELDPDPPRFLPRQRVPGGSGV